MGKPGCLLTSLAQRMTSQQFYIGYVSPWKPTQNEIPRLTRINCSSTTLLKLQPVLTAGPRCASDPSRMPRAPNLEPAYTPSSPCIPRPRKQPAPSSPAASVPALIMFLRRLHFDICQPRAQQTGLAATTRETEK